MVFSGNQKAYINKNVYKFRNNKILELIYLSENKSVDYKHFGFQEYFPQEKTNLFEIRAIFRSLIGRFIGSDQPQNLSAIRSPIGARGHWLARFLLLPFECFITILLPVTPNSRGSDFAWRWSGSR